ncbi:MAG: hypothetical protein CSB16_00810 [Clostridiales bacterium]|nr:MAG: hypothetical protein CSB16_00810 [Clostridiales bacterium]
MYEYSDSQRDFALHMRDISEFFKIRFYGVSSIDSFASYFEDFAKSRGVNLKRIMLKGFSKNTVLEYVGASLDRDIPVVMITWNNRNSDLRNHWITITGLYSESGTNLMVTSNWGEKRTYDFDEWYDSFSLYKGIVAFDLSRD